MEILKRITAPVRCAAVTRLMAEGGGARVAATRITPARDAGHPRQGTWLMKQMLPHVVSLVILAMQGTGGLSHAQEANGGTGGLGERGEGKPLPGGAGTSALPKKARLGEAGGQELPLAETPAQTTAPKEAVAPGSIQVIIDGKPIELTDDRIDEVFEKLGARYKRKPAANIQLQTPILLQNLSGQTSFDDFTPKVLTDFPGLTGLQKGWLTKGTPKPGPSEAIPGLNLGNSPYFLEPGAATGSTYGSSQVPKIGSLAYIPGSPGYAPPAPTSTEVYLNQQVLDLKVRMQTMTEAVENMRLQTKAILGILKSQDEILKSLKPNSPPVNSK